MKYVILKSMTIVTSLISGLYAMENPIENPLNGGPGPEIAELILREAAIVTGHTADLELVCQDWYTIVKGENFQRKIGKIAIIEHEDYHEKLEECIIKLSRNQLLTRLTIHYPNKTYEDFFDFWSLIYQGLQNKPNLESLTIVGNFEIQVFFQKKEAFEVLKGYKSGEMLPVYSKYLKPTPDDLDCWSIVNCNPKDLLTYPHAAFFSNLKEFIIENGYAVGAMYTDQYFHQKFLSCETLPKLKIFKNGWGPGSFDRSKSNESTIGSQTT